ncbi:MAG: FG-GAP repeat domain-containing protein, partial [Planctomycetota bacterium]
IGDFDGDGNRDLIITIRYPGAVVLLMGTGAGAFAPPNYLSASLTVPMDLAVADVNGDTRPDLLMSEGTNLSVLLGNGPGTFAPASVYDIGNFSEVILVDDINSDGQPDLVASSLAYTNVTILLGKAFDATSGPFITSKRFVTGGFPSHAAIVDINADGKPDVVTENSGAKNLFLLLGDGAGSLGASTNINVGFIPGALTVGDLNADGVPDLITANTTAKNISVLLATSSGGAVSFPSFNAYSVGTQPTPATNPVAVAVGDLNRDGIPDLVTANNNSQRGVSVLIGSGSGSFTLASVSGALPRSSIAIGDLNTDGNPDLVATSLSGNGIVSVMSGLGGGAFAAEVNFSVGPLPSSVEIGDLNGDGTSDVVTANSDWYGSVSVLLGFGTGTLGAATNFSVGESPTSVDVCDVNGDGIPDLLTPNHSTGVALLLGLGGGNFGPADYYGSGRRNITFATAGDLNADGAPDVLAVNPYQHSYSYISPGPADPYPYPSSISVLLNQRQQPAGNVVYGTGTAGCSGILTMRSNEAPKVNSPNFSLSCSNAPANSFGFGIVTDSPDMFGTYLFGLGIKFHVDFSAATQILTYDFISDAGGSGYSPAPIPNHSSIAGQTFYAQTLWVENAANGQACSQAPFGLVSSAGLALTIQP